MINTLIKVARMLLHTYLTLISEQDLYKNRGQHSYKGGFD